MNKKKGFVGKYGVSLITMNAFLRSAYPLAGRKIARRIAGAFAFHGKTRPTGTSIQDWCFLNADFIRAKGAGHRAESIGSAVPARAAAKHHRPAPPNVRAPRIDPNSPDFLGSYEWRALRMKVLSKYGAKCMCCGATPAGGIVINVDHIKPRRVRPDLALTFDNLQVLCEPCNHGKSNWDETDWRPPENDYTAEIIPFLRSL